MKRITANQFQTSERYYKLQKSCLKITLKNMVTRTLP